ncbi:probable methyltransferase-like protein 15 homolog [Toxorhynchites rutilus septentrionalis]|uniref:probable methyltransferase-like protein 15 homolog n=1 Tax=Toxorhynchites rutilus septentrionalis TaxID=329112 RepID=UPI00247ADC01|nr:probable methyltransferase-like protein 15 homolog [Toxorhynchites rutilus septentrionalis]
MVIIGRISSRLGLFKIGLRWCSAAAAPHVPVMAAETIKHLKPQDGELYIDMTFGAGGHTREILKVAPNAKIVALDRDPVAHEMAVSLAEKYPNQIYPILGRFSELPQKLKELDSHQRSIDGIIFDFGCSSMQFDEGERGFAISKDGPLDMRMDKDRDPDALTAAEILAKIDEADLARILKVYGEEKYAKKIARSIIEARFSMTRLATTKQLAELVKASVGGDTFRLDKLQRPSHPATKTFQALRIFVNNELNEINYGMVLSQLYLKIGGRMIAITFHSLEDTIVKRHLMGNVLDGVVNELPLKYSSHTISHGRDVMEAVMTSDWRQLTKQVVVPSFDEVEENPRSRSAKLRAAIRVR